MADDDTIQNRIDTLVREEQHLRETHGAAGLDATEQARLREVEVELERCWDLLRQRRAREEFGLDPDAASPRDATTVENYEQ